MSSEGEELDKSKFKQFKPKTGQGYRTHRGAGPPTLGGAKSGMGISGALTGRTHKFPPFEHSSSLE